MVDITKLSRKEREKVLRKMEIMKAAATLFSAKGFNHTTLEEIANKAEFGTGTIYNYFQSKEEIFKSIIESTFELNYELLEKCIKTTKTLTDFLSEYTRQVFEFYARNKEELLVMVSFFASVGEGPANIKRDVIEKKDRRMDELLFQKIKDGIKNKEIRKINPDNFYLFYHGLLFPYIANLAFMNKLVESEIRQHVNFIMDIIFNGILVR
jgi:AcrR family transcriptional regulator